MPKIILEHVTKRWGNYFGVDDLNLEIDDNAFITLLGPSGCGKTTTLRMIAGLETPTSGKITIGETVVFDSERGINVPASKRNVGFLFQNYALWPNMTVYQNITFGLKNVREEMPIYDYDVKVLHTINDILKKPEEIAKIHEDCYDKKGKLILDKVYLKIIDTYEVSMMTAKTLFGYNLKDAEDIKETVKQIIAANEEKIKVLMEAHSKKDETLNELFQVVKNKNVIIKNRKLEKEEIDLAVRQCSRTVKIGEFMDRYPAELSGGQQQRVAIARTLAPKPKVLFMDEPLSNLDAKLRLEMRSELQRLHINTGSTFVYVTHDQLEAMTLATKICLMNNAVLQQYEAPLELYHKPNNLFVADFVGNPTINFIEAKGKQNSDGTIDLTILGDTKVTLTLNNKVDIANFQAEQLQKEEEEKNLEAQKKQEKGYVEKSNKNVKLKLRIPKVEEKEIEGESQITNEDFILAIRPEFINLEKGKIEGVIYSAMPAGMETTVKIRIDNLLLTGVIFGGISYKLDSKIQFGFVGDNILLFDRRSGNLIGDGSIKIN